MTADESAPAILAAYDRERRTLDEPGFRRKATPSLVCHFPVSGMEGFVSFSRHGDDELDAAISGVVERFQQEGCDFEWKVYSHDTPADLRSRLAAAGFEIGEAEEFMILPVRAAGALLGEGRHVRIEPVLDAAGVADYVAVTDSARVPDTEWLSARLRDDPIGMVAYVAYAGAEPVACARATFPVGGRFAGLWSGATRSEYRRRGFYTALVAARARAAADRGFDYLTVDALPTSRPILERLGFRRCSTTYPCRWSGARV